MKYLYNKKINSDQLTAEINTENLPLTYIDSTGMEVRIYMSQSLTPSEKSTLDSVIASHIVDLLTSRYTNVIE